MTDLSDLNTTQFESAETFYFDVDNSDTAGKPIRKTVTYKRPTNKNTDRKKRSKYLLYLAFLKPFNPVNFFKKSKKNLPDAIRNTNRDTNWWRLEFLRDKRWLSALGTICTKVRALTEINKALARTNIIFAYLAWAYYLPRLLVNIFEISCITLFCVHWDKEVATKIKTQTWQERLSDIWSERWFEIVNDLAWIIVGLINCFIFFTNPVVSMYITVTLYGFDVGNALLKAYVDYGNQQVKLKNANKIICNSIKTKLALEQEKKENNNDEAIKNLENQILNYEYIIAENQAIIDTVYYDRKKWALYTTVCVCLLIGMICMCSFCPPTVVFIGTSFILATIITQWFAYRYLDVIKPHTPAKIQKWKKKEPTAINTNDQTANNEPTVKNSTNLLIEKKLNNQRTLSDENLLRSRDSSFQRTHSAEQLKDNSNSPFPYLRRVFSTLFFSNDEKESTPTVSNTKQSSNSKKSDNNPALPCWFSRN